MAVDFAALASAVESGEGAHGRATALLRELASAIRATSNDQNVQRLARDLQAAAPALAAAVAGKAPAGAQP